MQVRGSIQRRELCVRHVPVKAYARIEPERARLRLDAAVEAVFADTIERHVLAQTGDDAGEGAEEHAVILDGIDATDMEQAEGWTWRACGRRRPLPGDDPQGDDAGARSKRRGQKIARVRGADGDRAGLREGETEHRAGDHGSGAAVSDLREPGGFAPTDADDERHAEAPGEAGREQSRLSRPERVQERERSARRRARDLAPELEAEPRKPACAARGARRFGAHGVPELMDLGAREPVVRHRSRRAEREHVDVVARGQLAGRGEQRRDDVLTAPGGEAAGDDEADLHDAASPRDGAAGACGGGGGGGGGGRMAACRGSR